MPKSKTTQLALLVLSLGVFAAALFQPVWECGRGGKPLDGLSVLFSGFMGLLFFDPRWFCNAGLVVAIGSAIRNYRMGSNWLAPGVAIAASTVYLGPHLCAVTGGPLGEGTALAMGGTLWVASLWLAALSVLSAPVKDPNHSSVARLE